MANPLQPTILYPNGGESFPNGSEITISWFLPLPDSTDGRATQVEIYYTDKYDANSNPNWQQIAVVPNHASSYIWRVRDYLHSQKMRIAIRTRNTRGERSDFSISAQNFSINHRKLQTPSLISPVDNSRFDKYIEIIPDTSLIAGTYSQRSFYQFFYSSNSAGIPMTPLAQNIPISTKGIIWQTIDISPASDYTIYVFMEDDDGNKSDTLTINNITISHEGFFLIDTTPPVATISINDGAEFTQFQDVTVNIVTYDETTGVQSMQLIEGTNVALPEPVSSVCPFALSTTDGTKVIELLLQDFGANRNNTQIQRLFRTVLQQSGLTIVDLAFNSTSAWAITSGVGNYLYQIVEYPQIVYTFIDTPTAIAVFNSLIYVATASSSNKGTLYRYTGALSVIPIQTFTSADSAITCMENHVNILYIGFENGSVYSYDGSVLSLITSLENPISGLTSDGNSLYLAMQNDDTVYIYNGSEFISTGE